MLLNRHRIAKLIELADLERRLAGPERLLREEDVALLARQPGLQRAQLLRRRGREVEPGR